MIASFYEYLGAIWKHWTWLMTAGPFLLERITKQFWAGYEKWIGSLVSPELRLRLGVTAAVFGLFTASFLAFNDKNNQLAQLNASLVARGLEPPRQYDALDQSVISSIIANFKPLPKTDTFVAVVLPDPSAGRLAHQLSTALINAGFNSSVVPGWLTDNKERGIKIQVHHPEDPSPQAQLYISALRRTGLTFEVEDMSDEVAFEAFTFSIFVAPRQ